MARWRRRLGHPAVAAACLAALVFAAVTGARWAGWLQELELRAYDQYLRLRVGTAAKPDPRIVLVTFTEADIERYGTVLSDDRLAELLERLIAHGPRAIGLDIFRDRPEPPGTERLAAILRGDGRIIGVMKFPGADGVRVAPPSAIEDPQRIGTADLVRDPDGIVRRGLLYLETETEFRSSLALRLAALYLRPQGITEGPDSTDPDQSPRLGATTYVPLEARDGGYAGIDAHGYQFLLTYPSGAIPFRHLSPEQVFAGAPEQLAEVADRVVLIGNAAESKGDLHHTPLQGAGGDHQASYGVTLHGQITSQLIRQALGETRPMRSISEARETAWIGLWCALGGLAALLLRAPVHLAAAAAAGVLLLFALTYLAFAYGWWMPVVPPLLGGLASMGATVAQVSRQEQKQRDALMRLFSTYVSPGVAGELWAQRDAFLGQGGRPRPQQLTATVLSSDIRGFTAISEVLPPEELLPWLNEYMEAMAGLVMAYGGMIEMFAGDGITAAFGVPVPRTSEAEVARDAQSAARCALAMRRELARLNRTWLARDLPRVGVRIGITTGPLVVGSVGSAQRLQYSIIGDTTNTAARLESYERGTLAPGEAESCRILISEATCRRLGPGYQVEPIGCLSLKGKATPITVYRLLGVDEAEAPPRPEKEAVDDYYSYSAGLSALVQVARRVLRGGPPRPRAARRGGSRRGASAGDPGAGTLHVRRG